MTLIKNEASISAPKLPHPIVYMFLIMPFGVMSGYLTIALAYILSQAGFSVASIAGLVAISFIPHTWKFLWAPAADITLTRKKWYLMSSVVSALGIFAFSAIPANIKYYGLFSAVILIANLAVTFVSMSTESIIAYTVPEEDKGRASGWFQAGNLGGSGLGGGVGLIMARNFHAVWISGAVLGSICFLCSIALLFIAEPKSDIQIQNIKKVLPGVGNVLKDLWSVLRSSKGYLALLICFLPVGTGAASGLWSAVAGDWKASATTVELATGIFSGIVSAVGCIFGGYLSDRIDKKTAYALFGLTQAICAIAMGYASRTEMMFIVFTTVYAFISGLSYAGFSAVTFEAIGHGAAATKYSLFASLSNMPIAYMTLVDGWAHTKWGPNGMLDTEAFACLGGLLLFITVVFAVKKSAAQPIVLSRSSSE